MSAIPEFTESELSSIREFLRQRFTETVEIQLADAELRLDANSNVVTECPTVFWKARDCNFVVFKSGSNEFRCQFFYNPSDQFGTGHSHYNSLDACVSALLQVQSDHEREKQGVTSGITGKDL